MIAPSRAHRVLIILLALSSILSFVYFVTDNSPVISWQPRPDYTSPPKWSPRVTKVSMLYGERNVHYERALHTHRRHAERWGYGMNVLQNDIAVGYWNKPAYLLALVVAELAKPARDRVEWFMWVDADSVVINPAIPLDIFLPPSELSDIHLVATKDHKGLNTGIFFIRVHQWTVKTLIETMGYPVYKPQVDLGAQADQTAMEKVLTQTSYRDGVTYLPRTWINTYEWAHAYEGGQGNMLVHFPGLGEKRWEHMSKWLDIVESTPEEGEVPLAETWYPRETEQFWSRLQVAKRLVRDCERKLTDKGSSATAGFQDMQQAVDKLRKVLQEEPYEAELMGQRIKECNVALDVST